MTSSFILKLFLTLSATIGLAIGLIGEATTAVGGDIPSLAAAATTAGATTVGIDLVVAIELASLTAAMERTSRSQDSAGKYEPETFLIFKSSTSSDCNKIESKAELKYWNLSDIDVNSVSRSISELMICKNNHS